METSLSHTMQATAVCSGEHESQTPMVMIFRTGIHQILAMNHVEGHRKQIAWKRQSAGLRTVHEGDVWSSKEKEEFAKA
jgi:hypothetical protein